MLEGIRNSRCSSEAPWRELSLRGHQLVIGVFVAINGIKLDTLRNIISDFTDGDKEVFPRGRDGITRAHLATQDISDHFRLLQIILSVKCAARILRERQISTQSFINLSGPSETGEVVFCVQKKSYFSHDYYFHFASFYISIQNNFYSQDLFVIVLF